MAKDNEIIKIYSEEDVVIKKISYSKNTAMMSNMAQMETWGDVYIGDGKLRVNTLVRPSSLKAKLEIESTNEISKAQARKILDDLNNFQKLETIDGLAYTDDMTLIAMRSRRTEEVWFSTDECIDLMEPLVYETLLSVNEAKVNDYLLSIGDYLFYVNDSFQIKTIMAIIMDYYCDKAMPSLDGKHDQVTFQGAALMATLLASQLNHNPVGEIGHKRVFEEIEKANLLPNVLYKWHMALTDKIDDNALQEEFGEFLSDKEDKELKDAKKKSDKTKKEKESPDFDEELVSETDSTNTEFVKSETDSKITITKEVNNRSRELDPDNFYGTFLMSELIQNTIVQSDIVVLYNGIFPVLPDCDIEIENQNIKARIISESIICGMVENGILFIVIDDDIIDRDTIEEIEEVLTAENTYLEEILIYESSSSDGFEVQSNFNAMFAGQDRRVKTDD